MRDHKHYLYCVTKANGKGSFGPIGIGEGREEVLTVGYGGIAMVTSRAPQMSFGQMPPEETLRHLVTHQRVIEEVMKESAVVPMKFGTFASSDAEITSILEVGLEDFQRALENFEGEMEIDVVATWKSLESILREISEEPAIKERKHEILRAAKEESLEEKVRLGQLVKEHLDLRRKGVGEEIVAALRGHCHDFSTNEFKDDSMVVNGAFLISKSDEESFLGLISELDERYGGSLNFRCVYPLPPYSFATAEVRKLDSGALDRARSVLGLPEMASLNDVKEGHRNLARKFHPDSNPGDDTCPERLKEATRAFKLLEEYCQNFKHSFAKESCREFPIVRIRKLRELRAEMSTSH